jgi:membrane peptidoglycan carboxypeptidase
MRAVVDEKGSLLEKRHLKIERIISPEKAYMMNSLLLSVVTEGTAHSLQSMGISFPAAGKTGTPNDNRAAWFIGYTQELLALVWVGFDNGDPIYAEGSTAALPIWAELMQSIPQYLSGGWFRQPPRVVARTICRESGLLAVPNACPGTMERRCFCRKTRPSIPVRSTWISAATESKGGGDGERRASPAPPVADAPSPLCGRDGMHGPRPAARETVPVKTVPVPEEQRLPVTEDPRERASLGLTEQGRVLLNDGRVDEAIGLLRAGPEHFTGQTGATTFFSPRPGFSRGTITRRRSGTDWRRCISGGTKLDREGSRTEEENQAMDEITGVARTGG